MSDTQSLSSVVQVAVEAYRTKERRDLAADRAERDMRIAAARLGLEGTDEDRAAYFRLTEEIRAEFEAKRAKEGL